MQPKPWFPGTGVTSHMTADSGKLTSFIHIKDVTKFLSKMAMHSIFHILVLQVLMWGIIDQLHINNVLVVPQIKKNLLFISQLTSEYPYIVEFNSLGFVIKDKKTKTLLASGNRSSGLYVLKPKKEVDKFSTIFRGATDDVWHQSPN
ncbi:hypothetical protein LguiA_033318 [Lonicera macranthoides]